jgi:hypothetical protein
MIRFLLDLLLLLLFKTGILASMFVLIVVKNSMIRWTG